MSQSNAFSRSIPVLPIRSTQALRPLPFGQSLLYFAIPAVLIRLCLYQGQAFLLRQGLVAYWAMILSFSLPLALLLAAALLAYCLEGNSLTWAAFRQRYRLLPMNGKQWLWAAGGLALAFGLSSLLSPTARLIAQVPAFAPPAFFGALLNPNSTPTRDLFIHFMGVTLRGNWAVLAGYLGMLCLNIFGEELWWRGLILPRQELRFGRWAWLLHGTLWCLFHTPFYPWQILALLPVCLVIAYTARRFHSTTPAIVMHFVYNGLGALLILAGILGVGGGS
jgi:membrane protease YdiL (CAAX protease family)